MRSPWRELHAALNLSLRGLPSSQAFQAAKLNTPLLAGFAEPAEVVAYLTGRDGSSEEKDQVLATLVVIVQRRENAELGASLLWLGLWPGLSSVYGRCIRRFREEPGEIVAEIARALAELARRIDLNSVQRVAATLVRSAERDVVERLRRSRPLGVGLSTSGAPPAIAASALHPSGELDAAALERWTQQQALGVWSSSQVESPDAQVAALRAWLEREAGADAELLLAVLVCGESRREAGERLGLSSEAGRKRFQRALARLEARLEKSLSRFGGRSRFSNLPALRAERRTQR